MAAPIIDIHPHIASPDTARYPITPLGGKRSDWSHRRSVDLDEMIVALDEAGIAKAALVHSATTYGNDNSLVADAVALQPSRLTGVFTVDILAPDAVETVKYWRSRGLTGLRVFSSGTTMDQAWVKVDDPRAFPVYQYAGDTDLSVVIKIDVAAIPDFETILTEFPKTKFIFDHMGNPDYTGKSYGAAAPLFAMKRYPNLYLKFTSVNFVDPRRDTELARGFFKRLVGEYGANRLAWGSNYPATSGSLAELLKIARDTLSVLPGKDQDWLFGLTALELYPALKG